MSTRSSIIVAIIITILLLLAQAGYWFNTYIINPTNFKNVFTAGILNDQSKHALADEIVDQGFSKTPLLREFLSDSATSFVYSLLETRFFEAGIDKIADRVHERLTTPQRPDISIDVSRLKILLPIIARLNPELGENLQERNIPDKIVIARADIIPSLYDEGLFILGLAWVSFMLMIPLTIYYFYKRQNWASALKILGTSLLTTTFIIFIGVLTLQPLLHARINSQNLHLIAENISSGFFATYTNQLFTILCFGIILLAAGILLSYYRKYSVSKKSPKTN